MNIDFKLINFDLRVQIILQSRIASEMLVASQTATRPALICIHSLILTNTSQATS
jgi:hypothetical protein